METVLLAVPETTTQVTTDYRIARVTLNLQHAHIEAVFISNTGERRSWVKDGPTAVSLLTVLNTANLAVKSLHKRVFEQAIADGVFAGAVVGTPDA